jgi:hypothetical protein
MKEVPPPPWWQAPLRVAGVLLGLAALSALSMGLMFFLAGLFNEESPPKAIAVTAKSKPPDPPPPQEQNARNRVPSPYGPVPWPDLPGRKPNVSIRIGDSMHPQRGGGGGGGSGGGAVTQAAPPVPVGISTDEYRAAVESGKKLYLPTPKGKCALSGENTVQSMRDLEGCLAQQAAR